MIAAAIKSLRPGQWYKNLVVFAAEGFATRPLETGDMLRGLLAFALFCCLSSAGYLLNDLADRDRDRNHPANRGRPLASGELSPGTAAIMAAGLLLIVAVAGAVLLGPGFLAFCGGYALLILVYNGASRSVPILDAATIALGFVMRAFGGAAAIAAPISAWFGPLVFLAALLMVSAKRIHESSSPRVGADYRPTLGWYGAAGRSMLGIAAAALVAVYAGYVAAHFSAPGGAWFLLSLAPLGLGVARFALAAPAMAHEPPERWVFADSFLWLMAVGWAALFKIGQAGM